MIVLDTSILSELVKPVPDAAVMAWVAKQRRAELNTTTVSEAELAYGLALLPKGGRRDALAQAVARLLGEGLGGRVLPFDRSAASAYGELVAKRRITGKPTLTAEGQVAAIARVRGAQFIAGRDILRFVEYGLRVVDPWIA